MIFQPVTKNLHALVSLSYHSPPQTLFYAFGVKEEVGRVTKCASSDLNLVIGWFRASC